ncbi:MAG: fructose-6-phosphate aldolase [Clostridiales bacterium]|nr:fructose-6-phosphate aldolase [Clostridiales bacterium]
MKLIIDDADIKKIKEIYEFYPADGITTNPSIVSKTGRPPYEVLKEIREFIGEEGDLHVQTISQKAEDIVEEGHRIVAELGKTTYVKIPVTQEGLKAIRILSQEGYRTTATTIYTPMQAYLAAKAGADYAAPYVNRIDNLGANGIESVKVMQDIFKKNGFKTELVAASFKNSQQVQELCAYGIGAATLAPDVIKNLVFNPCNEAAIANFKKDFEGLCGEGKTMKDCE